MFSFTPNTKSAIYYFAILLFAISSSSFAQNKIPALEKKFMDKGLVDIQKLDPTIEVDLKYSTGQISINISLYKIIGRAIFQIYLNGWVEFLNINQAFVHKFLFKGRDFILGE